MKIIKQITNRESQSLDKYLNDLSKIDLISAEEEIDLAKKIRSGDEKSMERLVKANLRFVVSVAKQYQNQGLSLGDLINEGNYGLIKAAKRFDETRGFKFISYAVWWIRQSILQALAEQSRIVRLPLNRVGALNKISKEYRNLEQEFEREPTTLEIANKLNMESEEIADAISISKRHVSIHAPLKQGEENTLIDILENDSQGLPDNSLLNESLKIEIEFALSQLSEKESEVLKLYYGLNGEEQLTLEEIGTRFNLTRERVRQIKEKAIRRLRQNKRSRNLRSFLG